MYIRNYYMKEFVASCIDNLEIYDQRWKTKKYRNQLRKAAYFSELFS